MVEDERTNVQTDRVAEFGLFSFASLIDQGHIKFGHCGALGLSSKSYTGKELDLPTSCDGGYGH